MLNRIKQIIDKEKLSPTQFASEIGVQRSALSHVLSGRNNPSLDFMMKIKTRYPEINLDWLLLGKGKMTGLTEKKEKVQSPAPTKETLAEAEKPKDIHFRVKHDELDEVVKSKLENKEKLIEKEELIKGKMGQDDPIGVILLYPDDTFKTLKPRE